jgi:phthalate 4,5-cis-dihydrodiol dehydrogenase
LLAVCAEEQALADAFAAGHGGEPYGDWHRFLSHPGLDVVAIATPHHMHCEMAVAAAEAGKHVLLEKPMARTAPECSAIMAAVGARQRQADGRPAAALLACGNGCPTHHRQR